MRKVLFEGVVIVASFLVTWVGLRQIDWMTVFNVEQATRKTEEKLGEIFWDIFKNSEEENVDDFVIKSIDSLVNKICTDNYIDRTQIKVHILNKDDINAFALPGGHLILYTGIIAAAENEGEISGVIGHELAHIQMNHVMRKLIREVGLSVLISMTTGSGNGEMIKETAKMLSSTAFDRSLEKEADLKSVDYLVKANIDPESFANFLYKISYQQSDMLKYLTWVNTHPESAERAEYIIDYMKGKTITSNPVLTDDTWTALLENVRVAP